MAAVRPTVTVSVNTLWKTLPAVRTQLCCEINHLFSVRLFELQLKLKIIRITLLTKFQIENIFTTKLEVKARRIVFTVKLDFEVKLQLHN